MTSIQPITVGYWSIRGLGAPLRMMIMYSGTPLNAANYDGFPTEDGNFDRSSWFASAKEELRKKNPLINLPYIVDGDHVISQTNACFTYLGRKLNMLGNNEVELSQCDQLLCECTDLRNGVVRHAYGPVAPMEKFLKAISGSLGKLEAWLKWKYSMETPIVEQSIFFVGDTATAPDFHIWEMLDQIRAMGNFAGLADPLTSLPFLAGFHHFFANLPANARYLQSPLHRLPANFLSATNFGATPSGAAWEHGVTQNTWKGSAGLY
jgi:glutathione S-transferase